MTKRKKNNIIIGSLLAVVLLMAVGYAAFSSVLNIQGTGSISSKWNIKITNVEVSNIIGDASDAAGTTFEDLTATINSNLVSPGDSITYDVTIRNDGNIDAVLTDINLTESTNPAISFSTSNLTEGTELKEGEEAILKVTITYNNSVTSQPENASANLNITLTYEQKGSSSVVPGGDTITTEDLKDLVVTESDGLYADEYEEGRYIYKGANPNNYIEFNGEIWRIISVENDGSLKVLRDEVLPDRAFDSKGARTTGYCSQGSAPTYGCNAWSSTANMVGSPAEFTNGTYTGTVDKDSEMLTYLNGEYYNGLDNSIKQYVVSHIWNIGVVVSENNDLAMQIEGEKSYQWGGNIGLISNSEYIRANTNTEQCGTLKLVNTNYSTCKTTDWIYNNDYWWTLSPRADDSLGVWIVDFDGHLGSYYALIESVVRPAIYLNSNLTLSGSGTATDPYVPAN